jgi:hypothetical protein
VHHAEEREKQRRLVMASTNLDRVDAIEHALIGGDLSKLTPGERVAYYNKVCTSLELNPLTKPFAYIVLNNKLTLYALKDCTEQLRNKRRISLQIIAREVIEDCYVVTARATMLNRQDESIGAVPITGLKGEARANALMRAETKAKRRVTLSICGLGLLDEAELEGLDPKGYSVEAPAERDRLLGTAADHTAAEAGARSPAPARELVREVDEAEIPAGYVTIRRVDLTQTRNKNIQKATITVSTGETYNSINSRLIALCEQCCQAGTPVRIGTDDFIEDSYGLTLKAIHTLPTHADLDAEIVRADQARKAGEVL